MTKRNHSLHWVNEISANNFFRIYDVVIDLHEALQMSGSSADIPVYQSRVKWRKLLPIDSVGSRDEYCRGRREALSFLKMKGVVDEFFEQKRAQRWENRLLVTASPSLIKEVADVMGKEFEKNGFQDQQPESEEIVLNNSLPVPEKVSFSWLCNHVPVNFWFWFFGILAAVFVAGAYFGRTTFGEELFHF